MKIRNNYPDEYQNNEQFVCEKLLEAYRLKSVEKNTRYEHMIENLANVFDKRDICYEFSENLFSQAGLSRVTNNLGISSLIADRRSPNPSPKLTVVPTQIRQEIISFYKDTYLSILERFGEDVKAFWAESIELL